MSVAVMITYIDGRTDGYLPVATEATYAEEWLPAARALDAVWAPRFQTGTAVPLDALDAVRAELVELRDYFGRMPGASEHVRERSRWLVEQMARLDPTTVAELFIG